MSGERTHYKSDFLVTAAGSSAPSIAASFKSFPISDRTLFASDELPVSQLSDVQGRPLGLVLGFWISRACEGQLSPDTLTIPIEVAVSGIDGVAEWVYANCLGRYAFILACEDASPRFYPDASGSLSAVYQFSSGLIASRPDLCAPVPADTTDEVLAIELDEIRSRSGTWYPAGYCRNSDIRVVLPNHYVDLRTSRLQRFWSYASVSIDETEPSIERAISDIAHDIERVIDTVGSHHALTLSLTSGRDSRMILACCPRRVLDNAVFHTLPHHSDVDVQVARLLSEHFSLTHQVTEEPPLDRVVVQGVGGEVGRCFYWTDADFGSITRTVDLLAERLDWGTISHPLIRKALAEWLAELQHVPWLRVLDLAYIELRVACAHAPAMHDIDRVSKFSLYPMNGRSIFSAMLSLPEKWRYRHGMFLGVLGLKWPELLVFPTHKVHWTGWDRYRALRSYMRYRSRWDRSQRTAFMKVATADRSISRMISLDLLKLAHCSRQIGK